MLIFGHAGVTLGAAALLTASLKGRHFSQDKRSQVAAPGRRSSQTVPALSDPPGDKVSWLTSLGSYIDIRLLLIGSLLPDIIDKPVGLFFFGGIFSHGRIFCHTLLFLILVTLAGLYLYQRHRKSWLFILSLGTFTHLIFDQLWHAPRLLFWPFYGFAFERAVVSDWMPNMLHALLTDPKVYVPELVGVAILLCFGLMLVRRRKVCAFFKYGQVR